MRKQTITDRLGRQNHKPPLSDDDVRTIRKLRNHMSLLELARLYKRSTGSINQICRGGTYRRVTDKPTSRPAEPGKWDAATFFAPLRNPKKEDT